MKHIYNELFQILTAFLPQVYIVDSLLLFSSILTVNVRICHTAIKHVYYPATRCDSIFVRLRIVAIT